MTAVRDNPDLLAQPSAQTFSLATLVESVREGQVRVPHFQRGLRWKRPDAVKLIDSVLRGFPIGSLLLWKREAPAGEVKLGNVKIVTEARTDALYVVDGQQRITTFLNAFDPRAGREGEFALVYDLSQRPFRVRAAAKGDSPEKVIPLPVLFDLRLVLRWVSEHPQHAESIEEINSATQRLREFQVPAYVVTSTEDAVLRDIYDRMNNSGKRLSRAEAFRGLFAPGEHVSEATTFETIQQEIRERLEWGNVNPDTILQAFLARRGPDIYRDIHLEFDSDRRRQSEFLDEKQEDAQKATLEAIERVVEFLRWRAGVPHFTFLAYRYLFAVLTRFFAHFPEPDERNLDLLVRWYWRAALVGPGLGGGSATGASRAFTFKIDPQDESRSVQGLLDVVAELPEFKPDVASFKADRASGSIMLCALWAQDALSPETGESFMLSDLALAIESRSTASPACPQIYQREDLDEKQRNSLGNRVLMPGIPTELVRAPQLWGEKVRSSHLLGESNDPKVAVQQREEALSRCIDEFLTERTAWDFDDGPPLSSLVFDEDDDSEDRQDGMLW